MFGAFSSRHQDCLETLVRTSAIINHICSVEVLKSHCVHLLSILIGGSHAKEDPCILGTDLFSYLVGVRRSRLTGDYSNAYQVYHI